MHVEDVHDNGPSGHFGSKHSHQVRELNKSLFKTEPLRTKLETEIAAIGKQRNSMSSSEFGRPEGEKRRANQGGGSEAAGSQVLVHPGRASTTGEVWWFLWDRVSGQESQTGSEHFEHTRTGDPFGEREDLQFRCAQNVRSALCPQRVNTNTILIPF